MLPSVRKVSTRPKPFQTLARYVREELGDGKELIDWWLGVFRNKAFTFKQRSEAAKELANRGWGRSMQPIEFSPNEIAASDLADLDEAHLEFLAEFVERLKARPLASHERSRLLAQLAPPPGDVVQMRRVQGEFSPVIDVKPAKPD